MTTIRSATGEIFGYVHRFVEFIAERRNICEDDAILQVAARSYDRGFGARAHRHLPQERATVGTAEVWIVLSGRARATISNRDGEHDRTSIELGPGDCFVSLAGAHKLEALEDGTCIYEVKNGPYSGQADDKEWLE